MSFIRYIVGWYTELMEDIDSNTQAYEDQAAAIKSAIETYGTDHINGVSACNDHLPIEMDI